jgi:hypothetical protein
MQAKLKANNEGIPGPGEYDRNDEFSLFGTMTKKVSSRCNMFGSTAARFLAENPQRPDGVLSPSELPGPQSYNPLPPQKPATAHPTSNFASRTKRMESARAPTEPKPTEFEADDDVLGALFLRSGAQSVVTS